MTRVLKGIKIIARVIWQLYRVPMLANKSSLTRLKDRQIQQRHHQTCIRAKTKFSNFLRLCIERYCRCVDTLSQPMTNRQYTMRCTDQRTNSKIAFSYLHNLPRCATLPRKENIGIIYIFYINDLLKLAFSLFMDFFICIYIQGRRKNV